MIGPFTLFAMTIEELANVLRAVCYEPGQRYSQRMTRRSESFGRTELVLQTAVRHDPTRNFGRDILASWQSCGR